MPPIMLIVGTRKGCFVLESDGERRDWNSAARSARAGRSTTRSTTLRPARSTQPGRANGTAPASGAAATSARHGCCRAKAFHTASDGSQAFEVAGLTAAHGRLLAGAESAGVFESTDGGASWSLLSTLDGQPGRGDWNDPAKQPPGHLGMLPILPHPDDASRFWAIVQGYGIFETADDGASWTPRNKGLRADWPLENPEVGYCVHKLVMSPTDHDRLYQQNHVGMHRSDDSGQSWTEISEGLPSEFGFAAAVHPHDRDTFYVIPLDPGHGRCMPDGRAAVWRTNDAGSTWQRLDRGLPQRDAHLGVLREGLAIDSLDVPGLYFGTSTGQVFASIDEGDSWDEIASYLPAISSVEVAVLA